MTPRDQTIIDADRGDCQRAAIASLFDLEIEQVPHFRLYDTPTSFSVLYHFIWSLGWEYKGCANADRRDISTAPAVNGVLAAAVRSRVFKGKTHSVLIDRTGLVVHDPNPFRLFQGVNVVESGELEYWYIIDRPAPAAEEAP